MLNGRSGTSDRVDVVVVEMLTGCGAVVSAVSEMFGERVVVDVVIAGAAAARRIQHRTPRLRPRAPSTPAELVIPGFVMY